MLIVLNNKCNLTKEKFLKYQQDLEGIEDKNQIILCPSNLYLSLFDSKKIELGSQNVSKDSIGAYTGEIAAEQLASFNVKYCIVGHSERRIHQKETSKEINEKIKRLISNKITPIYCIGETKEERATGKYKEVLRNLLKEELATLEDEEKKKIIIAYEPIWSIGTGLIPTPEEINNSIDLVREILPNNKIIYGGSVNDKNIDILKKISKTDGYLLGGLSLEIENLKKFLEKLEN